MRRWTVLLLALLSMSGAPLLASPPPMINYQGYLTSNTGVPVNATVPIVFSLYATDTGGVPLWSESQSVVVSNGLYNVTLGTGTLIAGVGLGGLAFNGPYFLGVNVNANGEMAPRQALVSVPYAFRLTVGGTTGEVLAGLTGVAPQWTRSPELAGNLLLQNSAPGIGNILKGGVRFISNFGTLNTFIGEGSGNSAVTGSGNSGCGAMALHSVTSGNENTACGIGSLYSLTSGFENTAHGMDALGGLMTGGRNTATGAGALGTMTSGIQNTATGAYSLLNNKANDNTGHGAYSLNANTFGTMNTAVGTLALRFNTTGSNNTATGWNSLGSNTTGIRNTAIGESAMFANTTGSNNTASGLSALTGNTTGGGNTAIGQGALLLNATGNQNSVLGNAAMVYNKTGESNTAIGNGALFIAGRADTAGTFVTGVSYTIQDSGTTDFTLIGAANSNPGTVFIATGPGLGTGTAASYTQHNIALGANAGSNLTTGSFNINIGHGGSANESNTIRIGQSQSRAYIAGIRSITTGVNDAVPVFIDSAGQLGTANSSRRVKDDIADMDMASAALMKLRPVTFHYKSDADPSARRLEYGLIAEEVAAIYPGLVVRSADGQVETVMYQYLPAMLLNEYQSQQRTIQVQARHIEKMARTYAAEIAELKAAVADVSELRRQMAHLARLLDEQQGSARSAGINLK